MNAQQQAKDQDKWSHGSKVWLFGRYSVLPACQIPNTGGMLWNYRMTM